MGSSLFKRGFLVFLGIGTFICQPTFASSDDSANEDNGSVQRAQAPGISINFPTDIFDMLWRDYVERGDKTYHILCKRTHDKYLNINGFFWPSRMQFSGKKGMQFLAEDSIEDYVNVNQITLAYFRENTVETLEEFLNIKDLSLFTKNSNLNLCIEGSFISDFSTFSNIQGIEQLILRGYGENFNADLKNIKKVTFDGNNSFAQDHWPKLSNIEELTIQNFEALENLPDIDASLKILRLNNIVEIEKLPSLPNRRFEKVKFNNVNNGIIFDEEELPNFFKNFTNNGSKIKKLSLSMTLQDANEDILYKLIDVSDTLKLTFGVGAEDFVYGGVFTCNSFDSFNNNSNLNINEENLKNYPCFNGSISSTPRFMPTYFVEGRFFLQYDKQNNNLSISSVELDNPIIKDGFFNLLNIIQSHENVSFKIERDDMPYFY
jgi:hypothetical protein